MEHVRAENLRGYRIAGHDSPRRVLAEACATTGGPVEQARLEAELGKRIAEAAPMPAPKPVSRVEQAMRRNAPDLAGGTPEEIALAQEIRRAHHKARWPRPRLGALIVLVVSTLINPNPFLQISLWAIFFFVMASVVVGPECARDGYLFLWKRFAGLWKHEIVVLHKLYHALRAHLDPRSGAAL